MIIMIMVVIFSKMEVQKKMRRVVDENMPNNKADGQEKERGKHNDKIEVKRRGKVCVKTTTTTNTFTLSSFFKKKEKAWIFWKRTSLVLKGGGSAFRNDTTASMGGKCRLL